MTHISNDKQSGFALLITIIVLSVVLAVGLSLLEISLKQINLTITARESELAFTAANSGIECAQYSRFNNGVSINFNDEQFLFSCFGQGNRLLNVNGSVPANSSAVRTTSGNGLNRVGIETYKTQYDIDTMSGEMCVSMTVVTIDTRTRGSSFRHPFTNEGLVARNCPGNSVCTNIFSRGYNRSCSDIGDRNTVQREMTAEF